MNKKVIAAAIAAAVVAAPAAFAESVLYGKFHTSIDMDKVENSGATIKDNFEVEGRSSRVGVKGSEDLGDGLKAIYQLELGFNSDGGGTGQAGGSSGLGGASRNTFVGLAGGWGTFLVGRHDTPAKVAFYGAGTEMIGDSVLDINSGSSLTRRYSEDAPLGVFHEYRANDAIAYVSPNFAGFTVLGAIIPGEDVDTGSSDDRDGIADHYSVGARYKGLGGLKASLGYTKYDGGAGVDQKVAQIGASYTFAKAFTIGGHYEDTSDDSFVKGADYTAWGLMGKAKFGNNAISLVYTDAKRKRKGMDDDIDKDGWGIGAEHNFSKRTKVYAAYADSEDKAGFADDVETFSLGVIHNF